MMQSAAVKWEPQLSPLEKALIQALPLANQADSRTALSTVSDSEDRIAALERLGAAARG